MRRIDSRHPLAAGHVGSAPPTVADVTAFGALLALPEVAVQELAAFIEGIPGLRRAVLRVVNSVEFGLEEPVERTIAAVALLGLRRLERLTRSLQRQAEEREGLADAVRSRKTPA